LEQDFNSLDAQREACEAYITSQKHEGWSCLPDLYDDGGISGATLDRPALQRLLNDIKARKVDVVVVYKVDRLTRALTDFAKIVEIFDAETVSFVSVTQQFNTTSSMGRLTLNVLLSFAQFEREVTAERIRDKIAASKKKGMWMGGSVPLGFEAKDRTLIINEPEAETVRTLFQLYLKLGTVRQVTEEANRRGLRTKLRKNLNSRMRGGLPFYRGHIYRILTNPIYIGQIQHKKDIYPGLHHAIIDQTTWDAVQKMMDGNRVKRRNGTNTKHPSPLTGFLFDDKGTPFTPSHAVKKGRRYRYYVERPATQKPSSINGIRPRRIPAKMIEDLIGNAVSRLLQDSNKLLNVVSPHKLELAVVKLIIERATRVVAQLKSDNAEIRNQIFRNLIAKVELAKADVQLQLSRHALRDILELEIDSQTTEFEDQQYLITIPAQLRPRGEELKFVIPGPSEEAAPCHDPILIKALVSAHAWLRAMTEQDVALHQIAKAEGTTNGHIRRYLKLAFLAPDIKRDILEGRQAADLSLERITRPQEFPLNWDEQRRLFGA
jgi:DNA invertase Pin-like site-specific DNA recombinase